MMAMTSRPLRQLSALLATLLALAAVAPLRAFTPVVPATAEKAAEPKVSDDELRIQGIFNSALPGVEKKNRLKLIIHPHFGDFHRKDYVRMPVGLRYGLTQNWEITGEVETYFSHGLGDEAFFDRYGFASYHFGTKYRIGTDFWPGWDTGVGMDYITPNGSPPPDVTDGLRHFSYFVTFSRYLESRPDIRFFWGVSTDNISSTGLPVTLDDNELGDDSIGLNGGIVWTHGKVVYTFETTFATTRITGDNERDVITFRPGIVWPLPKRLTFNSRGQWFAGLAPRVSYGPDGFDVGVSVKLRASFDFKGWWRSKFGGGKKAAPAPAP